MGAGASAEAAESKSVPAKAVVNEAVVAAVPAASAPASSIDIKSLANSNSVTEEFVSKALARFQFLDTKKQGSLDLQSLHSHPQLSQFMQTHPFVDDVLEHATRSPLTFPQFLSICVMFSRPGLDKNKSQFLFRAISGGSDKIAISEARQLFNGAKVDIKQDMSFEEFERTLSQLPETHAITAAAMQFA